MPEARNMAQLEQMLLNQMKKAMSVASSKMLADTMQETYSFYTQGKPKIYVRTGALGDSPKTTALSVSGKTVSFEVYLNQDLGYDVPNTAFTDRGYASYFTGAQVLDAAEKGTAHILGKPGFWSRSEKTFQKTLDSTMRQFFK